jgi:probable F420-dependent oxidoreductase
MTTRIGRYGIWARGNRLTPDLASTIERLGFSTIWIGGSPSDDLGLAEDLLAATSSLTVATGIVNIWTTDATRIAESYARIAARFPGRFILGVGAGHPETSGSAAEKPFDAVVGYLDALDDGGVARSDVMLAALGPRMLRLARERTAGAHPYLVTPEHDRRAREILGDELLLAPEQRVVLREDPEEARAIGRPTVAKPYLGLVNYTNNLRRLGFSDDDLSGTGSDHLIDELVVYGDPATIASRLGSRFDAGADHVAIQLLLADDDDAAVEYARLAQILSLSPAES